MTRLVKDLPMRDMPLCSFGRIIETQAEEDSDGSAVGDIVYRDVDGGIMECWPNLEVYGPNIDGYFVDILSSVDVTVTVNE